ncbi:MAG: helix-turn-helix domain-containing protein [Ekhidna sp.]
MELGFVEIILLTSLINSVFFLGLIYLNPKRNSQVNHALAMFIFLSSVNFASWIILPYWVENFEWICLDRFPVVFFLGPYIYLFSNALFGSNPKSINKHKIFIAGYLDVLITVLVWVYIYFFSISDKYDILYDVLTLLVYESLAVIYTGYFVYKAIKIFLKESTNISSLRHVFIVIVVIYFLWVGSFLADLAVYPSQLPDTAFYPLWILMVYLNFYLAYHFILNPIKSVSIIAADKKPISPKTLDLACSLKELMQTGKLFRKSDLSLAILAAELKTSPTSLTHVLKEHFKRSYYDFINEHRILDIIDRFEKGEDKKFTIKTIAEEAGFNSKTTFIKAFKKETGMLPKEYISSLQLKGSSSKV